MVVFLIGVNITVLTLFLIKAKKKENTTEKPAAQQQQGEQAKNHDPPSVSKPRQAPPVNPVNFPKLPRDIPPLPPSEKRQIDLRIGANWGPLPPKKKDYLAGYFCKTDTGIYIQIHAPEAPEDFPTTALTGESAELTLAVQEDLDKKKTKLIETVQPIILDGRAWVQYAQNVRLTSASGGIPAECLTVETTDHGRRYQIKLIVYASRLEEYRNVVYAMAADAQFRN